MKLIPILEGVKLPKGLLADLTHELYSYFLSWMDADAGSSSVELLDKLSTKLKAEARTIKNQTVTIERRFEVPSEYANKVSIKPTNIRVLLNFADTGSDPGLYDSRNRTLRINFARLGLDITNAFRALHKGTLEDKLEQAVGTLEHELTHAVQHLVLSQLHRDQFSGKDAQRGSMLMKVEGPAWIKNSLKELAPLLRTAKSSSERRNVIHKFVGSDGLKTELGPGRSSYFFHLKHHDPKKWKDQVKELMKELN